MLLATVLLLGFFASAEDNFRFVTVTATEDMPATVQIQEGETAELVSSVSTAKYGTVQITFLKGSGGGGPWGVGIPLPGPANHHGQLQPPQYRQHLRQCLYDFFGLFSGRFPDAFAFPADCPGAGQLRRDDPA